MTKEKEYNKMTLSELLESNLSLEEIDYILEEKEFEDEDTVIYN